MDELSAAPFNLGPASGAADFLAWVGLGDRRPVATMREAVTTIRAWLAGGRMPGRFVRDSDAPYLRFAPRRVTPIYLGANGAGHAWPRSELADGALPLLLPPQHHSTVGRSSTRGRRRRSAAPDELDLAACVWISRSDDDDAARRALAERTACYGHALGSLIRERLGLTRGDFASIEQALTAEHDLDRACALVDDRMLRIGGAEGPRAVIRASVDWSRPACPTCPSGRSWALTRPGHRAAELRGPPHPPVLSTRRKGRQRPRTSCALECTEIRTPDHSGIPSL
jgi:5,10-methylenetetrahydromethanopterin reductase